MFSLSWNSWGRVPIRLESRETNLHSSPGLYRPSSLLSQCFDVTACLWYVETNGILQRDFSTGASLGVPSGDSPGDAKLPTIASLLAQSLTGISMSTECNQADPIYLLGLFKPPWLRNHHRPSPLGPPDRPTHRALRLPLRQLCQRFLHARTGI